MKNNELLSLHMVVRATVLLLGLLVGQQALAEPDYFTATRYNAAGQVTGVIQSKPASTYYTHGHPATRTTYNTKGLPSTVESGMLSDYRDETIKPKHWPGFTVTISHRFFYDSHGRKTGDLTHGSNWGVYALTQYNYDGYGRLQCVAVRMNPSAFNVNMSSGDACRVGPEGDNGPDRITKYVYNINDKLTYEYRAVNTPLAQTYKRYTYYGKGILVASILDANQNLATMEYDDFGRLEKWFFPHKTVKGSVNLSDYEKYGYDENGNRTSLRKRNEKIITYQYDDLNQVTAKNIPGTTTKDVIYDYDLRGLQLAAVFGNANGSWLSELNSGKGIKNTYTGFGELKRETNNVALGSNYSSVHIYDKNSNRIQTIYPFGVYFEYTHDHLNRLETINENFVSNPILVQRYDDRARPESLTTLANASITLDYDNVSRTNELTYQFAGSTHDMVQDFTFNNAGQILTHDTNTLAFHYQGEGASRLGEYKVNGLNQYESVGGDDFDYDPNGNLKKMGSNHYTYDVENRLITAGSTTLTYDPLGRLQKVQAGSSTPTYFLYSGDNMIVEYENSQVQTRYVHGGNMKAPLVSYTRTSGNSFTRRFLHTNHQGSVIAESNNSGGVDSVFTYDVYGAPGNMPGRFGYTGQMFLPELDMYYYRARIYAPSIGRFMQTDPVGYEDQMNLYAYVGNDPVNMVDPTGMAQCGDIEGSDCENSLDAADEMRDFASRAAKTLGGIADKIKNDGKDSLNESELAIVGAVKEKFGDAFQGAGGLKQLSGNFSKLAGKIGRRGSGVLLNRGVDRINRSTGAPIGGSTNLRRDSGAMKLTPHGLGLGKRGLGHVIIHEAAHLVGFGNDYYGRSGIKAAVSQLGSLPSNADSYACFINSSYCGF